MQRWRELWSGWKMGRRDDGREPVPHEGQTHENLGHEPPPLPSERSTGIVFAGVSGIVAVVFRENPAILLAAASLATGFAAIAFAAPRLLGPLNRAWFRLALALNRVMSPVIMFVLFALLIVPAGLAMQLRRDPLGKRRDPSRPTYWRLRTPLTNSMRDQF